MADAVTAIKIELSENEEYLVALENANLEIMSETGAGITYDTSNIVDTLLSREIEGTKSAINHLKGVLA